MSRPLPDPAAGRPESMLKGPAQTGIFCEHGVERGRVLGVPVADQEPERPARIVEVHHQVCGQPGSPTRRWGGPTRRRRQQRSKDFTIQ